MLPLIAVLVLPVVALCNYLRLRRIPGPVSAGISSLWGIYNRRRPGYAREMARLHQRYGPVVRTGPNAVSVSDPTAVATIVDRESSEVRHEMSVDRLPAAPFHHPQDTVIYETAIDQCVGPLFDSLRQHQAAGLSVIFSTFTTELANRLAHSPHLSYRTQNDTQHQLRHASRQRASRVFAMVEYWLLKSPTAQLKRKRYGGARTCICRTAAPGLALSSADELPGPAAATYNSDASPLTSTVRTLLDHPSVAIRLLHELDVAYIQGHLSDQPRWAELNQLPYLDAVLKECTRCFADENRILSGTTIPRDGVSLSTGHHLPQGATVECSVYLLRHNHDLFGLDTHAFNPDRWLVGRSDQQRLLNDAFRALYCSMWTDFERQLVWLVLKKLIPVVVREMEIN
ncbi:hypothetical protein ASPZODRAFT_1110696 [Penicilliopsis zonata CBS 506.65]|uniref:Cytochrome P450 n=1 Tax=Penicilliopsis zonata CBS 506.65 TaxID=1073090 RepID=A0A1L9SSP7_9EURO|nr:hypothetical protein ASPZODRAFT_1110696 [Penicilliopsis zonata CBS 506.65]OJJ50124.1 hypothetical protein ASPZODRAFT_1110696 [Penicilliopsis zonata CBS 506.65]